MMCKCRFISGDKCTPLSTPAELGGEPWFHKKLSVVTFHSSSEFSVPLDVSHFLGLPFLCSSLKSGASLALLTVDLCDYICTWGKLPSDRKMKSSIRLTASSGDHYCSEWGGRVPFLRLSGDYEPSATGLLGMRQEIMEEIKYSAFLHACNLWVPCPAPWACSRRLLELFAPTPTSGFRTAWLPGQGEKNGKLTISLMVQFQLRKIYIKCLY